MQNSVINQHSIFNKEILELLCKNDDKDDYDDDNYCLISGTLLSPSFVKLKCGHKFNYKYIYNEIRNQKKYNYLETQKLKKNQIKCPYCRTIQNGLIQHYAPYRKISGVNWPPSQQFKPNSCHYTFLSGKRKGEMCGKACMNKFCSTHEKIIEKRSLKESKKQKHKLMKEFQNSPQANIIIDLVNQEYNTTCAYVFRRGKNKGKRCKCKKKFNHSTHCKSHFKYLN